MRILIIKTSSLGDVLHILPALSDVKHQYPEAIIDWVVEAPFMEIASWHAGVNRLIPVAIRRWRKQLFRLSTWREMFACVKQLRQSRYDLIIDAQGLTKSAVIGLLAKGPMVGLNKASARDSFAPLLYKKRYAVSWQYHAVERLRRLLSQALDYDLPDRAPDSGIKQQFQCEKQDYIVFLHGTTWTTKHWPETYWAALAQTITSPIKLPWGNVAEKERAERIAALAPQVTVLPKSTLKQLAEILAGAKAVIAVDTGLGHLACALDVPTISLYGPTDPNMIGTYGNAQQHLTADFECAPCLQRDCTYKGKTEATPACFETVSPKRVLIALQQLLDSDV